MARTISMVAATTCWHIAPMKPMFLLAAALLTSASLAACGDGQAAPSDASPPDASTLDIAVQLAALPGVTVQEFTPPTGFNVTTGYRYYDLWFTEPVDHAHPEAGTFQLYAALMHRDAAAPLVIYTSGYDAGWTRYLSEPAYLTAANQISLEYRFYSHSQPIGGVTDWSLLNVYQASADFHDIITQLEKIYSGKRIATGGSKGGLTPMQHHQLYPGDFDAVVAYVPPVIPALPDYRYATDLDDIGIETCREQLRALQRKMLTDRDAMQTLAQADGTTYDIAGVAHATETSIVEFEFSFWMTQGVGRCASLPQVTDTDDNIFAALNTAGGPSGYGDAELLLSGQQYIYQDMSQEGYPIWEHAHLDDLMHFSYENWDAYLPTTNLTYSAAAQTSLQDWLATDADHVMIIGGQWDPWGPGYPKLSSAHDTASFIVPQGSHWSSGIYSLQGSDVQTALAMLDRWANVKPRARPLDMWMPIASMATRGPDATSRSAKWR